MATAIKTKKAPILWDDNNKVKAYYYGDKTGGDNKAIWYDENGKAYELIYARRGGLYSFNPMPKYDK